MKTIMDLLALFNAILNNITIVFLAFYAGRDFKNGQMKSGWVLLGIAGILVNTVKNKL